MRKILFSALALFTISATNAQDGKVASKLHPRSRRNILKTEQELGMVLTLLISGG